MIFEMNGRKWTIKEVPQEEMWVEAKQEQDTGEYFFGKTIFHKQEIWLDKDISEEQKRKTLIHELVHCYTGSYFTFSSLNGQDEDLWCDIMSNSFDIITEIVNKYSEKC